MKSPCSSQQGFTALELSAPGWPCGLQASAIAGPSCLRGEGSREQHGLEQDTSFCLSSSLPARVCSGSCCPCALGGDTASAEPSSGAGLPRPCSTRGHCTASFGIRIMLVINISHKLAEKHPSTLVLASLGFIPKCFLSIYQREKEHPFPYEMLHL